MRAFLELCHALGAAAPRTVVKNIDWYEPGREPTMPAHFRALFDDVPPDEYRATWADYWPGTHRALLKERYAVQPYSATEYFPCINLWKKLPIAWDGMVNICCLDLNRETNLGRVQELGIGRIWNGGEMRRLRRAHRRREQARLPLCSTCVQIRRPPQRTGKGIESVREDRFTPWHNEPQGDRPPALPVLHHVGRPPGD